MFGVSLRAGTGVVNLDLLFKHSVLRRSLSSSSEAEMLLESIPLFQARKSPPSPLHRLDSGLDL
jgi:hypothetical protein